MAVEWTITIEGRNEFGDTRRKEIRIDKSWESLFDGNIGLSIGDGKKIMSVLQSAAVNQEAETYSPFRRVCPACHTFRPVKDYTARRVRTVFGTVEVRTPLDTVPGLLPWHGRRLHAAEGNLSRSSDTGADGTDSAAGRHDAIPAGGECACRIPAR